MILQNEYRQKLVIEAKSWIGTPYISNGLVKGRRGGTDCAMLLVGIYQNVGLVDKSFDPRPYPAQWHLHQNAEKYLEHMLFFAHEVPGPESRAPLPGDIVLFKLGRVYSHGGIITVWPEIIHAVGGDRVLTCDLPKQFSGKRALWNLPKRFFSYWPEEQ
jgi:cell wall-associated NlpC family hydrolase